MWWPVAGVGLQAHAQSGTMQSVHGVEKALSFTTPDTHQVRMFPWFTLLILWEPNISNFEIR